MAEAEKHKQQTSETMECLELYIQKYLLDLSKVFVLYLSNGEWNSFIVCSVVSRNNKDRSSESCNISYQAIEFSWLKKQGTNKQYMLLKS